MKRKELLEFEQCSVRIEYSTKVGEHSRTGVIYSITMKAVIFWPFEQEDEISILFKDVKDVTLI